MKKKSVILLHMDCKCMRQFNFKMIIFSTQHILRIQLVLFCVCEQSKNTMPINTMHTDYLK